MSRTVRPSQELDKLAAKLGAHIGLVAEFALPDGRWLVVSGNVNRRGADLTAAVHEDLRAAPLEATQIQCPKPSAAFQELARRHAEAPFPPHLLNIYPNVSGVRNDKVKRLVRASLAEAFGQGPPPPAASRRKPASTDPAEWVAALKSGKAGVSRWNRLLADERKAVDLAGADLGGANLEGAKLRGVSLHGATLAGARLAGAELGGARLEGADLCSCDLTGADLKEVRATGARFRGSTLAKADLRRGVLVGATLAATDLTGANLAGADLRKADLDGASLDGADLEGTTFNLQTIWPAGFAVPAEAHFVGRGTDPRLVGKGRNAVATDINGLLARLQKIIDPKRMKRTLDMLKKGKNQLFAEIDPTFVRGIVRSQTTEDLVYSCVLTDDGSYACCTPGLSLCMGLAGEPCKHLLVLLIGLARAGQIDPAAIDPWVVAASEKNHRWNKKTKNHVSDTLLRYKGVEAGEIDWRPTETIPEDFYAF